MKRGLNLIYEHYEHRFVKCTAGRGKKVSGVGSYRTTFLIFFVNFIFK